jgi:hypothetical protein
VWVSGKKVGIAAANLSSLISLFLALTLVLSSQLASSLRHPISPASQMLLDKEMKAEDGKFFLLSKQRNFIMSHVDAISKQ